MLALVYVVPCQRRAGDLPSGNGRRHQMGGHRTGIMDDSGHQNGASWTSVVIVGVILLVAQLIPSPFRRHPAFRLIGPDKLLHFVGYAWFAASLADALAAGQPTDTQAGCISIVVSAGYGFAIGQIQPLVPGRVPETADLVAGVVGSLVGVLGWKSLAGTEDRCPNVDCTV